MDSFGNLGHLNTTIYLIESGANVKAKDYYNQTALHFSSQYGKIGNYLN